MGNCLWPTAISNCPKGPWRPNWFMVTRAQSLLPWPQGPSERKFGHCYSPRANCNGLFFNSIKINQWLWAQRPRPLLNMPSVPKLAHGFGPSAHGHGHKGPVTPNWQLPWAHGPSQLPHSQVRPTCFFVVPTFLQIGSFLFSSKSGSGSMLVPVLTVGENLLPGSS